MSNQHKSKLRRCFTVKRVIIAVGSAIAISLEAAPDVALHVWNWLPADIKAELPPRFAPAFGVLLVVLANIRGILAAIKRKGNRNDK
ncbi:hypothetical protein [Achromobacter phage shaaii_LB5]|nr:hypothetical protein [Achromobacter phage shaaii_LB5]